MHGSPSCAGQGLRARLATPAWSLLTLIIQVCGLLFLDYQALNPA